MVANHDKTPTNQCRKPILGFEQLTHLRPPLHGTGKTKADRQSAMHPDKEKERRQVATGKRAPALAATQQPPAKKAKKAPKPSTAWN